MSTNALISLHQLSYIHPNEKALFRDLTATISCQKTALVGSNGVGKSTLLRLILGELEPTHGSINTFDSIAYCPQKLVFDTGNTVVSFLGYARIINALERVEQGSIDPIDYDLIGDHWDIKEKVIDQLATIGLSYLALNQKIETLSGGEKTKLSLMKAEMSQSDLIILDEPTNHLDYKSRAMFYQWIEESDQGFFIVSHDRQLLDKMDAIIELNSHGLTHYGGNYSHYQRQKALIQSAREDDLIDAKKQLQKAKRSAQASKEKLEQKRSVGRKAFLMGKVDKLTAKSKQGRSESSQARNSITEDRLVDDAHSRVNEASAKIEMSRQLSLDLSYTRLPQGKKVFVFDEVSFRYPDNNRWIIKDFSLSLFGPDRVVIKGDNGVGKSTLLRLLNGELQSIKGNIERGLVRFQYMDQEVSFLDESLSVVDNYLRLNPEKTMQEACASLATFLFRNKDAHKMIAQLSGGERLRVGLACTLMSKTPPQCLILDEPSNHLDFDSLKSIESALRQFRGALIVVSHDEVFLKNIAIEREIIL